MPPPESSTSKASPSSPSSPSLLDLPRAIRKEILFHVLLNPASPDFEAKTPPANTNYTNYFAISLVNRQFHRESNDALAKSKALVVVSSNSASYGGDLLVHGIPTVSTSRVAKLKHFAMKLHVAFPNKTEKVVASIIVLSSELPNLSRLLRVHSLSLRHPEELPVSDEDTSKKYPRMSLKIRFGDGTSTTKDEQIDLLKKMEFANRVGTINILKAADPSVRDVLPGCSYIFVPPPDLPNNPMIHKMARNEWFRATRRNDGNDQLDIWDWGIIHAIKATLAMNHPLALSRYELVRELISTFFHKNRYVGSPAMDFQLKTEMRESQISIGMAQTRAILGKPIKVTLAGAMMASLNLSQVHDERAREPSKSSRGWRKKAPRKGKENKDGEEDEDGDCEPPASSMPSFEIRMF